MSTLREQLQEAESHRDMFQREVCTQTNQPIIDHS